MDPLYHRPLLGACVVAVVCAAHPGTLRAAELWGAYAGNHFDRTQGDEGYGISWNYPAWVISGPEGVCVQRSA